MTPRSVMAALSLLLLAFVFSTFHRYGFTSDDQYGLTRARNTLAFLASRGAESDVLVKTRVVNLYGAMPDVVALALQTAVPRLSLDSRHLVSALFGVIGILYVCRLGSLLGTPWTGPIAAVLLAFNPMWFGYMFINIKDIPFATALLAASHHGVRALSDERRPGPLTWIGLGTWSGLLATTKIVGLPMLAVVVCILAAARLLERREFPLRRLAVRAAGCAAAATAGTLLCAALFWPQLYLFTPNRTLSAMRAFMDFTFWKGKVLLNGVLYPHDQVPRHYVLAYLIVSMPLLIQAAFAWSIPAAIRGRRAGVLGLAAVPAAFLLVQAVTHSQVYDGYRHFLFVVPFVTAAAAFPLSALLGGGRPARTRIAVVAALAAFVGASSLTMARLFPYQYSSYNRLVGGTEGAAGRFSVDVWRSALREALTLIEAELAPGAVATVHSCGSPLNFDVHPRLRRARSAREADYVVALPSGCPVTKFPGLRTVAEVKRGSVSFATILAPR